ncbi:aminoglycoside adenylyltransferase domain-containing protein [Dictyobacter formicarum]|nr:aminoglycoside adenylyltransferase domain-containing protein [Dictyobacter formicarum]
MDKQHTDGNDTIVSYPTPYADVNAVLHDFAASLQALLGSHFRGMYLYGSLALGDFDPHSSDIDFIVVTDAELADDLFKGLQDLHERFDHSGSPWAGKIEAAYIPQDALQHTTATTACYPQVEKERPLFKGPLEIGWSFQRHTLREHGVRVVGPNPHQLFAPVDQSDLWQAADAIARKEWLERVDDPDWLGWARQRGSQSFVVLMLCRFLYTLDTGGVASKLVAARWVQRALGKRWSVLIECALAGQHESGEAPDSDMQDTIALIRYTVDQIEHHHRFGACPRLSSPS